MSSLKTGPGPLAPIEYPESDGKPMADNTKQFAAIIMLQGNLDELLSDVFVAGDLLWYPVKGEPKIRAAPDVLVVFGRPKGHRGSYRQFEEENLAPQVVFEVLSPGNLASEMLEKWGFYDRYGVEEYYIYDPDDELWTGFLRKGKHLKEIPSMDGWQSPRLGIRFALEGDHWVVYRPDGAPFETVKDNIALRYQLEKKLGKTAATLQRTESKLLEERKQKAEERKQKEDALRRLEELAAKLREHGIDPESQGLTLIMLIGKKLGPFQIEKQLGSGAMGSVYRAVDGRSGETVAVKIIGTGLMNNPTALERFQRECAILKQLDHPNVSRFIASGRFEGVPFYVMEFVEGESLDHVQARRGRITWEELVILGKQLCAGLQHAHDQGIIHRDLKPSNVMVQPDGSMKLTDFGIAKDTDVTALTAANSTLGTAAYMSPEQCRGARNLTGKADLYSMGVMFFELLTGQKPYIADNAMDMFELHTNAPIPRPSGLAPDIPIWLDTLVAQLMEKKPEHRPFSAAKVAEALDEIEQKVIEQKSAGVDRAGKRRIDRTTMDTKLSAEDKEAARALLGKKKKRKRAPFYRQAWFTLSALSILVAAFGWLFWFLVLKAPSADSLHRQIERRMASPQLNDRKEALASIDWFLKLYPEDDKKKSDVLKWRDEIDRDSCDFFLELDRRKDNDPAIVWTAYKEENQGLLQEAAKKWYQIIDLRKSDDPLKRAWGVTAAGHIDDIRKGLEHGLEIEQKIKANEPIDPATPMEKKVVEAMREHLDGDKDKAAVLWEQIRTATKGLPVVRHLYYLSLDKLRK